MPAFAHPKFQEEFSAKIPLALLAPVLRAEQAKRHFFSNSVEHGLSEATLNKRVSEISHPQLNEGLQVANQALALSSLSPEQGQPDHRPDRLERPEQ